jgi:hypothetical protein
LKSRFVVSMPPQAAADKAEQGLSKHGSVLDLDGNGAKSRARLGAAFRAG